MATVNRRQEEAARELAARGGIALGALIGQGLTRSVFEDPTDPTQVIKIVDAVGSGCGDNLREWQAWIMAQNTGYEHLRALMVPCVRYLGKHALVQKRSRAFPRRDRESAEVRVKVPLFFSDTHSGNFPFYEGQPRIHDYAWNRMQYADKPDAASLIRLLFDEFGGVYVRHD